MFEPEDGQSELVELGEFITADRAAAAHDIAALKYIGQVAPRNFTHDFEQVSISIPSGLAFEHFDAVTLSSFPGGLRGMTYRFVRARMAGSFGGAATS
jgi:hypothetical protein